MAEDCAMSFLAKKMAQWRALSLPPGSEGEERLKLEADRFARRFVFRLRRQRRREPSLEETPEAETLPSREPGPEELAIIADTMDCMLRPLPELTPNQQALFVRRFVEHARLVDLKDELGRSENALSKAIYMIRKRLYRIYEGMGMDDAEVSECLNLLDRLRPS